MAGDENDKPALNDAQKRTAPRLSLYGASCCQGGNWRAVSRLRTVYRLCPDAIYLPVDFDSYAAISQGTKAILHEYRAACR